MAVYASWGNDELVATTGYMDDAWERQDAIMAEAQDELTGVDFDTFVVTGLSGMLVAPLLAQLMGKKFFVLRKPNDGSHHSRHGASWVGSLGKRWIFLDDMVDTGKTRQRVFRLLRKQLAEVEYNRQRYGGSATRGDDVPFETTHVGTYEYRGGGEWTAAENYRKDTMHPNWHYAGGQSCFCEDPDSHETETPADPYADLKKQIDAEVETAARTGEAQAFQVEVPPIRVEPLNRWDSALFAPIVNDPQLPVKVMEAMEP
jgi:hypoxanthine phosphoribosyltransferase